MKVYLDKHKNVFDIGISYFRRYAGMSHLVLNFGFVSFVIQFVKDKK